MASGLRAIVTAVNTAMAPGHLAGCWCETSFLHELPESVDPMGENGEFHTCVVDGPVFQRPLTAQPGRIVRRRIERADDEDANTFHPEYIYADVELGEPES